MGEKFEARGSNTQVAGYVQEHITFKIHEHVENMICSVDKARIDKLGPDNGCVCWKHIETMSRMECAEMSFHVLSFDF